MIQTNLVFILTGIRTQIYYLEVSVELKATINKQHLYAWSNWNVCFWSEIIPLFIIVVHFLYCTVDHRTSLNLMRCHTFLLRLYKWMNCFTITHKKIYDAAPLLNSKSIHFKILRYMKHMYINRVNLSFSFFGFIFCKRRMILHKIYYATHNAHKLCTRIRSKLLGQVMILKSRILKRHPYYSVR